MYLTCMHAVSVDVFFASESEKGNVGFTDDNQEWLKPAKKAKLNLSDSDDDMVSYIQCLYCICSGNY